MSKKRISVHTPKTDVPYDAKDRKAVLAFWDEATPHKGVSEYRAKRGRLLKAPNEKKAQIALRVDADVLA